MFQSTFVKVQLIALLFLSVNTFSQENSNFMIVIGNDTIPINLNESKTATILNKKNTDIKLIQPDVLTYQDEMISFNYNNNLSVSNSDLGDGIEQCALLNANGSGFMVQKYSSFNPSLLTELMLNELTKESVNYGYSIEKDDFSSKLKSGQTITGTTATLTYKGETESYTVATYGQKDEGILVVTMLLNNEYIESDQKLIDLFLNSLTLYF
ncbi:MAG: hypothetical protein BM564_13235 [Bacteroidetes bacterium MedPE-SWsnd-G2]|nr:MAG: hypothetical protein BM564_13235 [Bacteroidetes bacterium MedPE-SWsnd-G2]